jgi:hypothetical protein
MHIQIWKGFDMRCKTIFSVVAFCLLMGALGCSTSGPIQHGIVYYQPGRFCGWPANNGIWNWDNEIVVGFHLGYYKENKKGHSIDRDKPRERVLARSLDGGKSWTLEKPQELNSKKEPVPCPGGIDFTHPDFAMTCRGGKFWGSDDRCKTWQGPYKLPDFGQIDIMARTDYIVNGKDDCLVFLTATKKNGKEGRPFCARMTNGGRTMERVSWIAPEPTGFSIMPSTVRVSANQLISAIRRKEESRGGFIEVYTSTNNGKSWGILSRFAAITGRNNGNPASMVRLKDGRIALAYGYRSEPQGIRARISPNNGRNWSQEIILRDDGRTWDIGYPQTVQRPDGKLVTIYYYTTAKKQEQHIAATIWDPDKIN